MGAFLVTLGLPDLVCYTKDMEEQALQKESAHSLADFFAGVYSWMFAGLVVSGVVAYAVSKSPTLISFFLGNPIALIILVILQFALVILISANARKMSTALAGTAFLAYAAAVGITLSTIFLVYTSTSIMRVFFIAASMFLVMSIAGFVTKFDLSKLGAIMFMGLIGIIVATLVNFFFHSNTVQLVISYLGVVVFLGLTAFEVQKLKQLFQAGMAKGGTTIAGALMLYLDLLNIFLFLLRIFGNAS